MSPKTRLTSQKQIIIDYLLSTKSHPSAEKVYNNVKKKLPCISKSTVYRNLDQLTDLGQIQLINTDIKRFDGDICLHHHFICKKCQLIYDIFPKKTNLRKKIKNIGEVYDKQIIYHGICKKCL